VVDEEPAATRCLASMKAGGTTSSTAAALGDEADDRRCRDRFGARYGSRCGTSAKCRTPAVFRTRVDWYVGFLRCANGGPLLACTTSALS